MRRLKCNGGLVGLVLLGGIFAGGCGKDKAVENLPAPTAEEKANSAENKARMQDLKKAHPGMSDEGLAVGAEREKKAGRR